MFPQVLPMRIAFIAMATLKFDLHFQRASSCASTRHSSVALTTNAMMFTLWGQQYQHHHKYQQFPPHPHDDDNNDQ